MPPFAVWSNRENWAGAPPPTSWRLVAWLRPPCCAGCRETFMDNPIDFALVHRFSWFQSLNADQIAAFATQVEEVRLQSGKILFRQGDPGDSIYLLVSGQ